MFYGMVLDLVITNSVEYGIPISLQKVPEMSSARKDATASQDAAARKGGIVRPFHLPSLLVCREGVLQNGSLIWPHLMNNEAC